MPTPATCDLYRVTPDDPQVQPLILQLTQRIARLAWGSATAFRLGMLARYTGLDNPYDPGSPRHAMFNSGAAVLMALRADRIT